MGLGVVDAWVARKRHLEPKEPLSRTRLQAGRESPSITLGDGIPVAIVVDMPPKRERWIFISPHTSCLGDSHIKTRNRSLLLQ